MNEWFNSSNIMPQPASLDWCMEVRHLQLC